jgi:hypothetical protein
MRNHDEQGRQAEVYEDDVRLAKKLAAAFVTHQLGQKSIDNVYRRYINDSTMIGAAWIRLARQAKKIGVSHEVPAITNRTQ